MVMAVEHAEEQGVKASFVIQHGAFAEEIVRAAQEQGATLVVLGKPGEEEGQFKLEHLKELAASLEEQSSIPFVILPEE
jgi:nucleotide-binding universal stress UspA family protein